MEPILRASEVAKRMRVHRATVVYWIRKGYFPNARKLGPAVNSPYGIPESDVIALEKRLHKTPDEN